MNLKDSQAVDKSQLLDLMCSLDLVKRLDPSSSSDFIVKENIAIFESVITYLAQTRVSESTVVRLETVRTFFLNLNYLWGDWLLRDKLMNERKRPDTKRMSPKLAKQKPLLSVPVI